MRFCFHSFMPMKRNISFAGFRLSQAVLTFVTNYSAVMPMKRNISFAGFRLSQAVLTFVTNYSAVIWENPISSQLHFSRKSRFSFQVFLRMFLIVDFSNFWFDKSA